MRAFAIALILLPLAMAGTIGGPGFNDTTPNDTCGVCLTCQIALIQLIFHRETGVQTIVFRIEFPLLLSPQNNCHSCPCGNSKAPVNVAQWCSQFSGWSAG